MHIEYQTDTNKRAHAQNKQNRITFVPKTGKEHLQLPFKYTRTTWFLQTVVTAVTCFLLQHCNSSAPVKTLANSCQALRLCVHVVLADASLAFSLLGIGRLRTKIPLAVDWSIYKYEPTRSQAYLVFDCAAIFTVRRFSLLLCTQALGIDNLISQSLGWLGCVLLCYIHCPLIVAGQYEAIDWRFYPIPLPAPKTKNKQTKSTHS